MERLVDTNVLLDNPDITTQPDILIHTIVLEEIDNIIHNSSSEEKKYKARQARNSIKLNKPKFCSHFPSQMMKLPLGWDENKNDNKLLLICDALNATLVTNDIAMQIKADSIRVKWEEYNSGKSHNEYKGYVELDLTTDDINNLFTDLSNGINTYNLIENQYVIINEKGKKKPQEFRFSKHSLVDLVLPDSKFIKGVNSQQRCALDLLNNKEIPIKILAGKAGSGKTYLSTKMALYHIFKKGNYGKMLILRNPLGSGEAIGFLKGDKEEKMGDFFKCVEQYIDPVWTKDKNINDYIERDIPFYIKGMSYGSKFVLVDETEDMDLKILRLIGTRIEGDSCVTFCGDYKQAESKYKNDNGLFRVIQAIKGNPLFGMMILNEDVRSEASKIFADIE